LAYREISVVEVREFLRRWAPGNSLRSVSAAMGADRKTVRRYVHAARMHGLERGGVVDDARNKRI